MKKLTSLFIFISFFGGISLAQSTADLLISLGAEIWHNGWLTTALYPPE